MIVIASMLVGCITFESHPTPLGMVIDVRLKSQLEKEARPVNPASPEELFAREYFQGGQYTFVILNRAMITGLEVTPEGLFLKGPDGKPVSGRAVQFLQELHEVTRAALDPANTKLDPKYYWWTRRDLAAPSWDDEHPPLKKERDRFYGELKQALSLKGGSPVMRVRMTLPYPQGKEGQGKRGMVACVVVHDDSLHKPTNYLAHLAKVDPAHVRQDVKDRHSIRVLDAKLQEYLCQAEFEPLDPRQGLFVGSKALYQSAVTLYLDKRESSAGKLEGLTFISQYLAATIINVFQRGPAELGHPEGLPVGLFVETKERQMEEIDGGRKYVMHRFLEGDVGRDLGKGLREAVELIDMGARAAPRDADTLAYKLRAARQLADDPRRREPVRRALKMFLNASASLMPDYTQKILQPPTPPQVSTRMGARK